MHDILYALPYLLYIYVKETYTEHSYYSTQLQMGSPFLSIWDLNHRNKSNSKYFSSSISCHYNLTLIIYIYIYTHTHTWRLTVNVNHLSSPWGKKFLLLWWWDSVPLTAWLGSVRWGRVRAAELSALPESCKALWFSI